MSGSKPPWEVEPTPRVDEAPNPAPGQADTEETDTEEADTEERATEEQEDDLAARLRFDPDAGRPSWYRPPPSERSPVGGSAGSTGSTAPSLRSTPRRPRRPAPKATKPAAAARQARARQAAPAGPPPSAGPGRRARGRRTSRRIALPVLAGLIVAAFALVGAIIGLTKMVLDSVAGNSAAAAPLVVPAPAYAGGLPRLFKTTVQPDTTLALIAQFRHRFVAATGGIAGGGASGPPGGITGRDASGQPSAQYREPGTLDLATDKPAWVEYLGYNSDASLGSPPTTILKLMSSLTGNPLPSSSWSIPAGARGGSARCAITKITGISVSICAWATENTFGALMSPTADTKGDELAVLLPQMRLDLQPG
jgi:hypothetical protein